MRHPRAPARLGRVLGVHFALTDEQRDALVALVGDDEAVTTYVHDEIEESWDDEFVAESDKSWWGIHVVLTGGAEVGSGESPLNATIFGTRLLADDDTEVVALTDADEVPAVARALATVTESGFRERYDATPAALRWPEHGPEDLAYMWDAFVDIRALWEMAAALGRSVLFSAS